MRAACRNRTDDLRITSALLWPTELRRQSAADPRAAATDRVYRRPVPARPPLDCGKVAGIEREIEPEPRIRREGTGRLGRTGEGAVVQLVDLVGQVDQCGIVGGDEGGQVLGPNDSSQQLHHRPAGC